MADELPPAVQRFIANMDDYDEPLEEAMRLVDEFASRNDDAAVQAREALATAAESADKATLAYKVLTEAVELYERAELSKAAVQAATTAAQSAQNKAILDGLKATILAREATESLTEAEAQLAAAEGFAADHAEAMAEADAVVTAGKRVLADAIGAEAKALVTLAAAEKLASESEGGAGGAGAAAAAAAAGRGGRGVFGWLGATIGGVAAWHIALDLIVEGLISIGTAALAATVGLAAMYPAANNIYDRLTSMYDVTHALGQNLLPLHNQFDALAHAMAPQVVEAFGGALNMVNGQAGVLGQTAHTVVGIFDTWIAKIDVWANSQNGLGGILRTGTGYLEQFGSVLGKVGLAIGNVLRDDPGIAHYLLDLVGAFASLLDWVTKLPGPLLTLVLGLHGLYLWGRVLGGVFGRIGTGLIGMAKGLGGVLGPMLGVTQASGAMEKSFLGLSMVSWAWIGVVAAAFAGIAYESLQADSATKKFITDINTSVSAMSPAQAAYGGIAVAISGIRAQMAGVPQEVNKNWNTLGNSLQRVSDRVTNIAEGQGHAITDLLHLNLVGAFSDIAHGLSDTGAKAIEAQNDLGAYRGEIVRLTGDQSNLFQEIGHLMQGTVSYTAANKISNDALGQTNTTFKKVTTAGFTFQQALALMGIAGVKASDSFAVMEQKVKNLITGYQALGIQGGILKNSVDAVTFSTELGDTKVSQLTQAWSTFFSTLTGGETGFVSFAQDMQSLDQAMAKSNVSMTGLNKNSLAARSQFLQNAQAAQTEMNNLTTLSAAAGEGAKGTAMLTQANKDLVAEMLPAAEHSSALTTILYGLAQQGGYHGADAFKALSTWVGNTKDPMTNLDSITTRLTGDAGNLTRDVNALAGALNQNLNAAMSAAIIQADGGQQAFNTFADTIVKNKNDIQADIPVATNFAQELIRLTGNTTQAKSEFVVFAEKLGLTKNQADRLWASVTRLHGALGQLHSRYFTITGRGTGVYSISTNAGTEALLHHATVGAGGTTSKEAHVAEGGIMRGGVPGHDSIRALLMPGEGVLTTRAVRMIGEGTVHHLNRMAEHGALGSLHRMASGGVAGSGPSSIDRLAGMPSQFQNHMTADMIMSMERSMTAAERAAASAAQAAMGGPGGGRTSAGGQYNVGMLERLWESAGGPAGLARIMAAIALAESGGSPIAHNASGASGLWQILGQIIPGNIFNPMINAENAVAKWRTQGLGAWVTYTSGAYREFMDNGGWLKPGTSLVTNNTGRPERVLSPNEQTTIEIPIYLDGREIGRSKAVLAGLQESARRYSMRNSGNGPGSKVFAAGTSTSRKRPLIGGPPVT